MMKARELFNDIYWSEARLASLKRQIDIVKDMRIQITAQLTGMPKGNGVGSKIEDGTVRLLDLQNALVKESNNIIKLKTTAIEAISRLTDPRHKIVLESRYLSHMSEQDIADELQCTTRYVRMLHVQALECLEKYL